MRFELPTSCLPLQSIGRFLTAEQSEENKTVICPIGSFSSRTTKVVALPVLLYSMYCSFQRVQQSSPKLFAMSLSQIFSNLLILLFCILS